jgi:hypothetical protein
MARRRYVPPDESKALARYNKRQQLKEHKVFEVVTGSDAAEIEKSGRDRGITDLFFKNLNEWYKTYEGDDSFLIPLNLNEGDFFHGRATDSLYTTLNTAMKRLKQDEWKLRKFGKTEEKFLYIKRR